jgi:hypothetical protein
MWRSQSDLADKYYKVRLFKVRSFLSFLSSDRLVVALVSTTLSVVLDVVLSPERG